MVGAAWADLATDLEARDLVLGWAVVEDQAAQELVAAEPAALARREVAAGAPACGSQGGRAVAAALGQELAVRVVAQAAVDMAAEEQEPARRAPVGLVVEAEPAVVAAQVAVDMAVEEGQELAQVVERGRVRAATVVEPGRAEVAASAGGLELQVGKAQRLENGGRRQQCCTRGEAQG